jgi:hypothetical protein
MYFDYDLMHVMQILIRDFYPTQIFFAVGENPLGIYFLQSIHTPGIRLHGIGVGTKNAGVDKKSENRVDICKRSFLRHYNILQ